MLCQKCVTCHDTIQLLNLSTHASLHEINLPVFIIISAVIIICIFDFHAKAVNYHWTISL